MNGSAGQLDSLLSATKKIVTSGASFDDSGQYRVEIPSVEGIAAFETVIAAASSLGVPLHRVSQGSGITLLRDKDLRDYAALGAEHRIEVCLFVGPRGPWEGNAAPLTPGGGAFGWRHTRVRQLEYAYADVCRAVEHGIRSVLVADEGLLRLISNARISGDLPSDLIVKASALMGVANPVGAEVLEENGADTINVASDCPVEELAAFRAACSKPLDLYVESPDDLGGFVRYHEIGEMLRVAAPMHLKFGLRNAANIYPSGEHLDSTAIATARERVRRAAIGIEFLERDNQIFKPSPNGTDRLGLPNLR